MSKAEQFWLNEENKSEFVKKLKIVAGTVFIVLLVSALSLSSPCLGFAAVLSLAIPKIGEKLYSKFFLSQTQEDEQEILDNPSEESRKEENEPIKMGTSASKSSTNQYGPLFNDKRNDEQTQETDLTVKKISIN
ncbi:MAG TPA: hypothetical protein VGH95_01325 [Candidatus Aquirickettsiella sp.]|jgi:hypothetical protein